VRTDLQKAAEEKCDKVTPVPAGVPKVRRDSLPLALHQVGLASLALFVFAFFLTVAMVCFLTILCLIL
jgi:hypothetical protein